MAAKLHFLFVLLGARNTFLWGKKIIPMGYFFVKQYGESTSENPLPHWIDEDYKLYDHRLHRWTQIIFNVNCPDYFPQITQMDTDLFLEHEPKVAGRREKQ